MYKEYDKSHTQEWAGNMISAIYSKVLGTF